MFKIYLYRDLRGKEVIREANGVNEYDNALTYHEIVCKRFKAPKRATFDVKVKLWDEFLKDYRKQWVKVRFFKLENKYIWIDVVGE